MISISGIRAHIRPLHSGPQDDNDRWPLLPSLAGNSRLSLNPSLCNHQQRSPGANDTVQGLSGCPSCPACTAVGFSRFIFLSFSLSFFLCNMFSLCIPRRSFPVQTHPSRSRYSILLMSLRHLIVLTYFKTSFFFSFHILPLPSFYLFGPGLPGLERFQDQTRRIMGGTKAPLEPTLRTHSQHTTTTPHVADLLKSTFPAPHKPIHTEPVAQSLHPSTAQSLSHARSGFYRFGFWVFRWVFRS